MTLSTPNSEALADTLRRSDHLFLAMQDGVIVLDPAGVIIDVNPASEQMFGFAKRELVGRRSALLHEPESETTLGGAVQDALATGRWEGEIPFRRKDGTTGIADVVIVVPCDREGKPMGALSVHRDMTERRLVEEALSDTEARFHLMFDANPLPMWVYDVTTLRFLEVNASAVLAYGYSRTEFLNMTLTDIRPQNEIPSLHTMIEEDIRDEYRRRQIVHRRKDGREFVASTLGCNINFWGRRARLVTAQDVSAQIHVLDALARSEEMLREAQRQLGGAVVKSDADPGSTSTPPKRILLVEDDTAVRTTMARILEKAGYLIVEAGNGDEALARWRASDGDIDAVMSDAVMPGLRGIDLLRQLRRERPSLPVLLVSGYLSEQFGELGRDGEIIPVLEKPFTSASLIARLESMIH